MTITVCEEGCDYEVAMEGLRAVFIWAVEIDGEVVRVKALL